MFLLLTLFVFSPAAYGNSLSNQIHLPQNIQEKFIANYFQEEEKLRYLKLLMIKGEFQKAKIILRNMQYKNPLMPFIQNKFIALIYFIEGKYQSSVNVLEKKIFNNKKYFNNICLLKSMNYFFLKKKNHLKKTWYQCLKEKEYLLKDDKIIFLYYLIQNYLSDKAFTLPFNYLSQQDLSIIIPTLQLALFFDQGDQIFPHIHLFDEKVFENTKVRELIGFLYYKKGLFSQSFPFIEDLTSLNAQNMKANFYLLGGKDEIAMEHLKLALKKQRKLSQCFNQVSPS